MSIEDKAQEVEAEEWARRNIHRKKEPPMQKPGDPGYGPAECEECESEMPKVRRAYGFTLCTACKTAQERRSGR